MTAEQSQPRGGPRAALLYTALLLAGVMLGLLAAPHMAGTGASPQPGAGSPASQPQAGTATPTSTGGVAAGPTSPPPARGPANASQPSPMPAPGAAGWEGLGAYLPPSEAAKLLSSSSAARPPYYYYPAAGAATITAATATVVAQAGKAAAPPAYGSTNVQVAGVDEPDIVENNGTYIFVARGGVVKAYRAWPPRELRLAAVFDAGEYVRSLVGPEQLLLRSRGGLEVVLNLTHSVRVAGLLGGEDGALYVLAVDYPSPMLPGLQPRTWVIALGRDMKPRWAKAVSGALWDARLAGDALLVATTQWRLAPPVILDNGRSLVAATVLVGTEPVSTTIAAFDARSGAYAAVGFAGAYPRSLYMSSSGLVYLALPGGGGKTVTVRLGEKSVPVPAYSWSTTRLVALRAGPGRVEPVASTTVPGVTGKQWQLDLYRGILRLVVTVYTGNGTRVDLYLLNATTLKEVSRLEGIAVRERIHAVRFIGPRLYLVTFRSKDPLFAIDLSDPRHPRVLGYLEAPGFDEYLHPLPGDRLLGVGREDRRLRVTLYKLQGAVPKPVSRIYIGPEKNGYTWSPLLEPRTGHRAFTYWPEAGAALIPFTAYSYGEPGYPGTRLQGVAVVKIDGDRLSLEALLEHSGAQRATYIDGTVYTIAPGLVPEVKAWSLPGPRLLAAAPEAVKATVEEILRNPDAYRGKIVDVVGVYGGWSSKTGQTPPVTRSDWILRGKTGAEIYVAGAPPAPPSEAGKLTVRVVGAVEEKDGRPYIRPLRVEIVASTAGK